MPTQQQQQPPRGCLTAHFFTKIDLDYPCALATNTSAETAKQRRVDKEAHEKHQMEMEGVDAEMIVANKKKAAAAANPMAADIPYVANVTQATLEIRKSAFFKEKRAVMERENAINASIAIGGKRGRDGNNGDKKKKKKFTNKEEEAAAAQQEAILADPLGTITGAHFALNVLPEIGNTGRPLTVCHFKVEEGNLVDSSNNNDKSSDKAAAGPSPSPSSSPNDVIAIVRMPIHMCTSVGRQGRADPEEDSKQKTKAHLAAVADLGEGGSSGLAGFELIYVPKRFGAPKAEGENAKDSSADGEKKNNTNNKNNKNKKNAPATSRHKKDVFPVPYFDVSVTIAGVQYTYLLPSQFDVLAGRPAVKSN